MSYWVLKTKSTNAGAFLSALPPNGPSAWRYKKGQSLQAEYLAAGEGQMCFAPDYPDAVKLHDFVDGINNVPIISSRVKQLLATLGVENAEYLPVTLLDHQMAVAADDYFILNILGSVDCIDMEKSEYRMDRLIKDQIGRIKNLVLDEGKIPPEAKIFRPSVKLDEYFISDELKAAFEEQGISNCKFLAAQGWDGMEF